MATIDGLVSSLPTTDLINSLMTLEAGGQSMLKTKQAKATSLVSALQALNTRVASLAEHATKAAKVESWGAVKASLAQSGVTGAVGATATAAAGAQPGTLTFRVTSVAASQASLVTLPPADAHAGEKPSFTITRGGTTTTVTAASASLADVTEAFNAAGTGVRATAVKVDVLDADGRRTGETTSRLQLTGADTGAANAFTVAYAGADGPVALGTDTIRAASDASLTLFPGSAAAQTLTSSSNTFAGVLTGVDLTVSTVTAADAAPVNLTVSRDDNALKQLASGLVTNLNTVLSEITSRTKSSTTTASDGRTVVSGGLFAGDTSIRLLQQSVLSQASLPVNGVSPADVGIVLNRDGTFTFDDTKLTAAIASDPAKVEAVVRGVSERLATTAKKASDPSTGTLTQVITTQQGTVRDLGDRIASWDDRLAVRRASLERTYAALEITLQKMNAQSSYLTSQLAALTSQSTNR